MYKNNKKAWTSIIFKELAKKLNNYFKKSNKKILLFMDNSFCHINSKFSNIKIVFFPKNTSVLQPLNKEIIQSFKAQYKNFRINRYILRVENGLEPTPPNILDALYLIENS